MKYLVLTLAMAMASFLAVQDRGPDGRYHDPDTNQVQPDVCDNLATNPHPCQCLHARPKCDGTDTWNNVGRQCQTWCRPHDCHCDTCCDEHKQEGPH